MLFTVHSLMNSCLASKSLPSIAEHDLTPFTLRPQFFGVTMGEPTNSSSTSPSTGWSATWTLAFALTSAAPAYRRLVLVATASLNDVSALGGAVVVIF